MCTQRRLRSAWPRDYKTIFMLSSVEHEILNADKYKNIKKVSYFLGSDKPRMLYFQLINVKMPTIVGIANNCWHIYISEQKKIHAQLS